jgi:hypothetical protein
VNVIGVVVVEDKELGVAGAAGDRKAPSLIGKDFAGGFNASGIAKMGALALW